MMVLTVNGRPHQVPVGTTLHGVLEQLRLCPENVVAAINDEVAEHDALERVLQDGDRLDLMAFVGGG